MKKLIICPHQEVELRNVTFFKELALRTHLERKFISARKQFAVTSASTVLQDVDSPQQICEVFLKFCMPARLQHCPSSAKAMLYAKCTLQSCLKHRDEANGRHRTLQLNCLKCFD